MGYVNSNSPKDLARNILPEYLDLTSGCNYMLISPSKTCIFALGTTRFGIYKQMSPADISAQVTARVNSIIQVYQRLNFSTSVLNTIRNLLTRVMQKNLNVCGAPRFPSFERRFQGMFDVRAIIENSMLNIYSKSTAGNDEFVVCSLRIAPDNAAGPLALVLDDSGKLSVYDRNNMETILIDANGNLNTGVATTDTGSTSPWIGNLSADLNGSGTANAENGSGFDTGADFWRRLHNLKLYLRLVNDIVNNQIGAQPFPDIDPPTELLSNLTEYDAGVDYVERYNACLDYLKNLGLIDYAKYTARYITPAASTVSSSDFSATTLPGLDGSYVTSDAVIASLNAMDAAADGETEPAEQTPEEITKAEEAAEALRTASNSNAQNTQSSNAGFLQNPDAGFLGNSIDPENTDIGLAPPFSVRSVPLPTHTYTFDTLFAAATASAAGTGAGAGAGAGTGGSSSTSGTTGSTSGILGWDTQAEYITRFHHQFSA